MFPRIPSSYLCLFQWGELWEGGSSCFQGYLSSSYNSQAHRRWCDTVYYTHPVHVHLTLLRTLVFVQDLTIDLVALARLSQKPHRPRPLPVLYSCLVKLLIHSLIVVFLFSYFPPFNKDAIETLRCLIGSFLLGSVPLPPSSMDLALWAWCVMRCAHASRSSAGDAPVLHLENSVHSPLHLLTPPPSSKSPCTLYFCCDVSFTLQNNLRIFVPVLPNIVHIFLVITQKLHFNFKKIIYNILSVFPNSS